MRNIATRLYHDLRSQVIINICMKVPSPLMTEEYINATMRNCKCIKRNKGIQSAKIRHCMVSFQSQNKIYQGSTGLSHRGEGWNLGAGCLLVHPKTTESTAIIVLLLSLFSLLQPTPNPEPNLKCIPPPQTHRCESSSSHHMLKQNGEEEISPTPWICKNNTSQCILTKKGITPACIKN